MVALNAIINLPGTVDDYRSKAKKDINSTRTALSAIIRKASHLAPNNPPILQSMDFTTPDN